MGRVYTVVDLFSGAGGFQIGFENSGFEIIFSTDFDKYCEAVHIKNRPHTPFFKTDIRDLSTQILDEYIKRDVDVLIGGPPCQGFSTIGSRVSSDIEKRKRQDPRNVLFEEYIRVLKRGKKAEYLKPSMLSKLKRLRGKKHCTPINAKSVIPYRTT
jgi:DNA (cytosine-5)-methyltransferase 1